MIDHIKDSTRDDHYDLVKSLEDEEADSIDICDQDFVETKLEEA